MNKIYKFYSVLVLMALSITNINAWTFTWNGSFNSDWSTAANWTRTGTNTGANTVPAAADNVFISNGALSNQPVLSVSLSINTLSLSAGSLEMNGSTLTIGTASFTGGSISNGFINATDYSAMQNTTFTGLMIMTKTGGSNNDLNGGNTFNGPLAFFNNSNARWRLAVTTPDAHTGGLDYQENGSGAMEPAYNGVNTYAGDITTQGSANAVTFGAGNGTVQVTGNSTIYGAPDFRRLTINSSGTMWPTVNLSVGELRMVAGGLHLQGLTMTVTGNAFFTGGTTQSGTMLLNDIMAMENASFIEGLIINKVGGGDNTVAGGNTFGSFVAILNSDNSLFRMANTNGDDYNGTITFQENSSGQLEPAYNGNNTFGGEISTAGSASSVSFGNGTGVVVIDGNTFQSLVGSSAQTPLFNRLRMNTTGVLFLNGVQLNVSKNITFVNGDIISLSTALLILDDNITISGTSDNSHVNGPVRKVGDDAFTFPVGNGIVYAPISISAPALTTHHFTAQYFNDAFSSFAVTGLDHVSTEEYWILDRTFGLSNVRVTLSHNASTRSGPVNNISDLRVARFDGSNWISTGSVTTTGSNGGGTVESNNVVSDFSPFTLGSSTSLNPLPVSLLSFDAEPAKSNVLVTWSTSNETNNDFFTIEKSLDGMNWLQLGVVEGAKNSNTTLNYELIDMAPVKGIQYYRLKQTDLNGVIFYSAKVPVRFSTEADNSVIIYPQPAGNVLNVAVNNNENENVNIVLYSAMGQKMIEMNGLGGNNFQLDLSALASGIYYLELIQDGFISKTKLLKQ